MEKPTLTHIDGSGQPRMVDVSGKEISLRMAEAEGFVVLGRELLGLLNDGDLRTKKGPVFQTAIIAGIQGAKKTWELVPMCHVLPLEGCKIEIAPVDEERVRVVARVKATHKTGVEMEALTAVSIACLTIYDMCKAISKGITITDVRLLSKAGGQSGDYGMPSG